MSNTDRERFEEFFEYFNIEYHDGRMDSNNIEIDNSCENVEGYIGFFTLFRFDEKGNFLGISIGE